MRYLFLLLILWVPSILICQKPITTAEVEDFDGNKFQLIEAINQDKNTIINVYASWCGPCKREWIDWANCIDEYQDDFNMDFLVIGTGYSDKSVVKDFFESRGLIDKVSIVYIDQDTLFDNYGVNLVPVSYIFSKNVSPMDTLVGMHECDLLNDALVKNFGPVSTKESSSIEDLVLIRQSSHEINIRVEGNEEFEVWIYSLDGKKLYATNKRKIEINVPLEGMGNGIKVIRVLYKNQTYSRLISIFQ